MKKVKTKERFEEEGKGFPYKVDRTFWNKWLLDVYSRYL